MKIRVVERHMAVSKALSDYAVKKVSSLNKYFDGIISIDVVMDVEKENQIVELVAHLVKRKIAKAHAVSEDMYASVDEAVEKLRPQLTKAKEQLKHRRPAHKSDSPRRTKNVDMSDSSEEIVRTQVFLKKPMTVEEALLQLKSYHKEFLIFMDSEREGLSILYRLNDGQYELLEPVF
jgi:putative sigma-54 modulation protein